MIGLCTPRWVLGGGGGILEPLNVVYVAVTASDRVMYSEVGSWGGRILEPLNVVYEAVTASDRVMYSKVGS